MREIKFRAKDGGGEWVYGSLLHTGSAVLILPPDARAPREVDERTVGQHTGLRDREGVPIYEGDVVRRATRVGKSGKRHGCTPQEVTFSTRHGRWQTTPAKWHGREDVRKTWNGLNEAAAEKCVIVGNIHDNPELATPDDPVPATPRVPAKDGAAIEVGKIAYKVMLEPCEP